MTRTEKKNCDTPWYVSGEPDSVESEETVSRDAPLIGRTLEPWRGLLAVALWLDAKGERVERRSMGREVHHLHIP